MTGNSPRISGQHNQQRGFASVIAFLLAFAVAGCGTTYSDYEIDPGYVYLGDPLVEPLPLTVGVYYSPEFRSHEEHLERTGASSVDRYHLRLGPSSVALFDRVLEARFTKVQHIDNMQTAPMNGEELDAIIEVKFGSVRLMSVGYGITLYTLTGMEIATFNVSSSIYSENANEEAVAHALRLTMRNAAAQFLIELSDHPDVHAWVTSLGLSEPLAHMPAAQQHS